MGSRWASGWPPRALAAAAPAAGASGCTEARRHGDRHRVGSGAGRGRRAYAAIRTSRRTRLSARRRRGVSDGRGGLARRAAGALPPESDATPGRRGLRGGRGRGGGRAGGPGLPGAHARARGAPRGQVGVVPGGRGRRRASAGGGAPVAPARRADGRVPERTTPRCTACTGAMRDQPAAAQAAPVSTVSTFRWTGWQNRSPSWRS